VTDYHVLDLFAGLGGFSQAFADTLVSGIDRFGRWSPWR